MKKRVTALALALVLAMPVAGAAAAPASIDVLLVADVTVDAGGRIRSLRWGEQQGLHALVAQRIEAAVRQWQFEPGKVDGVAAETRTQLSVHVVASDAPGGGVDLRFVTARTGPTTVRLGPPRYPMSAYNSQVSAEFLVTVAVTEDGSPSLIGASFTGSRGDVGRAALEAAVEAVVREWTFVPETVAGHPVSTRLQVTVEFCRPGSNWCEQQRKSRSKALDVPPGTPVALDSAVQLKTDILAQQI
jgi:TonB family protein